MRLTFARPAPRSAQAGPRPNQSFGRQRVRSGITSAELNWPDRRLTVNLAPAELRKEGSGFDLPIALAVLAASRQVTEESLRGHASVGELALDGRVRPVAGVLAAAEGAKEQGLSRLFCAASSAPEAALAGIEPVPLHHLAEAASYLRGEWQPEPFDEPDDLPVPEGLPDLADVRGQERARRALELAAADPGGVAPAARRRRDQHRAGRGEGHLSGALSAGGDDEPLSLRRSRRPGRRVLVFHATAGDLPRQALAGTARPLRPARDRAASAGARARRSAIRGFGARADTGRRGARALARAPSASARGR